MNAGKLNKRITIQQFVNGTDNLGDVQEGYVDFHTCWASVENLIGRELILAQSVHSEIEKKVRFRYVPKEFKNNMRIMIDNVSYRILSIINIDNANQEYLAYVSFVE